MLRSADAIVVGGGVSGCIVARRLAEGGRSVVLIEAGPGLPLPAELRHLDVEQTGPENRAWTDATQMSGGHESVYRQGRGLGGSGAVNGALLARPSRSELNRWSETGGVGWGFDSFDPWIKRALSGLGPPFEVRDESSLIFDQLLAPIGTAGTATTLSGESDKLLIPTLAAEGAEAGTLSRVLTADQLAGVGECFELMTNSTVHRLRREGSRATGVELADGAFVAGDLIVLCAGALQTPLLLARSGMLEGDQIEALDHGSIGLMFDWPSVVSSTPVGHRALVRRVCRWTPSLDCIGDGSGQAVLHLIGPFTNEGARELANEERGERRARGLALVSSASSARRVVTDVSGGRGPVSIGPCQWGPRSKVVAATMGEAVRQLSDLLAVVNARPSTGGRPPEPDSQCLNSADDLLGWMGEHPGPTFHLAGTLRMRTASDCDGGVARFEGLSNVVVADSSVLPDLPFIGPQLTVMAVAERASDQLIY